MSKVSVITINHNNANGLEKTIKSVISQTYRDYEYIVIDGGSNDGSKEIIEKQTTKITYWISEKDKGIYNAMNKGIQQAKGTYCLFLNSGDTLVDNNVLDKVFSGNNTEDILYGELIFDFGKENKKLEKLPDSITIEHLFKDNIWHPASFIKRQLFESIGLYNESYKIAADYDFFFHAIVVKKVSTKHLPFPISIYNTDGMSSKIDNLNKIEEERRLIHQTYLSKKEIDYLNDFKEVHNKTISKWLVNKPFATKIVASIIKIRKKVK